MGMSELNNNYFVLIVCVLDALGRVDGEHADNMVSHEHEHVCTHTHTLQDACTTPPTTARTCVPLIHKSREMGKRCLARSVHH